MNELDDRFHDQARSALFKGLYGCELQDDIQAEIEKSEILKAFDYSGSILRSNLGEDHYRLIAETVFETCIRLVRCLFFPKEARTIILQGKEYSISAEQQIGVLRRNLREQERHNN